MRSAVLRWVLLDLRVKLYLEAQDSRAAPSKVALSGIQAAICRVLWGIQLSIEEKGNKASTPENNVELGDIIIGYSPEVQRGILHLKAAHHMAVYNSCQSGASDDSP